MKKRILGLMLIAGIVLALGTSAFAASATLKPTLSIKKLNDGTAGSEYSQAIKATVSSSDTSLVVSFDTTGLSDYGFAVSTSSVTATKQKEATLTLSATKLTQASKGLPIKVRATNTHSGDKYITEQTFTLKIKGNKPEITAPTETDLGTAFFTSTGIDNLKRGVGVVGLAFPTQTDNAVVKITASGTLPITMTATGLPDGLTAVQDPAAAANTTGEDGTATLKIIGTPTEAGKFSIKVTANNEVLGSKSSTFKLTILEKPSITTTSLSEATYGKKYSFKMKADGGTSTQPLAFYATGLPSGFTISSKDGTISGTISKDTPAFSSDGTLTFSGITVGATSYASDNYPLGTYASAATGLKAEKTFTLNIKPAKPTFLSKDVYSGTFNISTDNNQNVTTALALASNKDHGIVKTTTAIKGTDGIYVFVSYPWAKLSVKDAPAGLTIASADTTDNNQKKYAKKYIKISGTATEAGTKTMQLTATNSAGSDTLKIKFKVDAPDPTISGTGPSGAHEVDEEFTEITFSSTQALNWKATKLPAGMTLTAETDGKSAKIAAGKYTKAQTATEYTITGTNKTTGKKAEVTGTVTVYNKPVFKTTKLGTGTTGKTYKTKVELKDKDTWISDAKLKTSSGTTIYNAKGAETGVGTFQYISKDKTLSVDLTGIPTGSKIGVYFKGKNGKDSGTTVETVLSLDVKGTAPKITTTALNPSSFNKAGSYSGTIEITGTLPITTSVYIASSDVQKLGLKTTAEAIRFGTTPDGTTGLTVTDAEANGKHTITLGGTVTALSMKSIPLTVEATNGASTKSAKKVFKFDINGGALAWKLTNANGKKASDDISVSGKVGSAVTSTVLYTSADKPFTVKVTGAKDGITVTSTDSSGLKTVTIGGTPTKAGKIVVTALLQNTSTKDKHQVKVTVEAAAIPVITSKDNVIMSKDFTVGKNVSMKASAKPGKNLTWSVTSAKVGTTDVASTWQSTYGLTFNTEKGTISGTALKTTSASNTYAPLIVKVKATHSDSGGESGEGEFRIGIKGAKLSLQTKTIKIRVNSTDAEIKAAYSKIETNPTVTGGVTWSIVGDNETPITISDAGVPSKVAANAAATKGKTLTVKADNMGTVVTGKIKVIAYDPKPTISTTIPNNKTLTATKDNKVTDETSFTVSDASITGDTKIKWSITRAPEGIGAKIKANTDDNGKTATLTLTVPKGYKHGTDSSDTEANYSTSFTVRATNSMTQEFASNDYTVKVNTKGVWTATALPENKEALPEDEELTEDEETADEETDEVKAAEGVTLGAARTEASLTAGQRAAIAKEGYIIAAVLPEMTVAESGQYDLEVELYEKTPEGAKLVWFAFPQGVEASTDDEIAEFFDEAGADIETVPASRKIVVSPWLEAEVTYAPVIVVKAEDADGAKDSLEGAEAGDVVTEEALAAAE